MGRWAQQRKRGGDLATQSGLPAGPELDRFGLDGAVPTVFATWTSEEPSPFGHWRSRWRVPSISVLWTPSASAVQTTVLDTEQVSPHTAVLGQQQDCEIAYCDAGGTLLSGWSGYAFIVP